MAEETPAATTDTAGIARTPTGEITTPTSETTTPATPPTDSKPVDQKPAADTKAEGGEDKSLLNKDAPKEEAKPQGAPEKYEDYKVPEGFTLDAEVKTEADKLFKEANLPQEVAQKFVDFYTAKAKEAFEAPFNRFQDMRKEWQGQAQAHPELKGKLAPGGEVLTTIGRAIESLGDSQLASEFRQIMDDTGAGDHPAFIRTFYRMAQRLTEGSHVAGRGPAISGQQRPNMSRQSAAQELWPNLPSANRG